MFQIGGSWRQSIVDKRGITTLVLYVNKMTKLHFFHYIHIDFFILLNSLDCVESLGFVWSLSFFSGKEKELVWLGEAVVYLQGKRQRYKGLVCIYTLFYHHIRLSIHPAPLASQRTLCEAEENRRAHQVSLSLPLSHS